MSKYFISYCYYGRAEGMAFLANDKLMFANCEIEYKKDVEGISDINAIKKQIQDNHNLRHYAITIISWKKFENP